MYVTTADVMRFSHAHTTARSVVQLRVRMHERKRFLAIFRKPDLEQLPWQCYLPSSTFSAAISATWAALSSTGPSKNTSRQVERHSAFNLFTVIEKYEIQKEIPSRWWCRQSEITGFLHFPLEVLVSLLSLLVLSARRRRNVCPSIYPKSRSNNFSR